LRFLNVIAEGGTEEVFVRDVMAEHFAQLQIYVSVRRITTGWDSYRNKPAKGGLRQYSKLRNDILRWISSDNQKPDTWYTSFIDLYAFPKGSGSPYTDQIQNITDPFQKVAVLEEAISADINDSRFIPYVQLHEFEAFLLAEPERLKTMFPDAVKKIDKLKVDIAHKNPEEINESPQQAPSKRIIRYLPEYANQKAQVGPLVAQDIGLTVLRNKCRHFNDWMSTLENIA
jgi:hypothetical protein